MTDWRRVLLTFLHDPPDKALAIPGHEQRAARYACAALGEDIDPNQFHSSALYGLDSDALAAIFDRLPLPKHTREDGSPDVSRRVEFLAVDSGPTLIHPLSGRKWTPSISPKLQDTSVLPTEIEEVIRNLCKDLPTGEAGYKKRFLVLWRFLPERLAKELDPLFAHVPADTRVPDHTVWHHNNLASALEAALGDGNGGALLAFSISPVQSFIEHAKSLRDLWSGSYLLSWLTFQAILAVIEDLPPSVVIFPALWGATLYDWWIGKDEMLRKHLPERAKPGGFDPLFIGALPNTFLALVPQSSGDALAEKAEKAARAVWREVADRVKQELDKKWQGFGAWDSGWNEQIEGFWDIRTAVISRRAWGRTTVAELERFFKDLLGPNGWPPSAPAQTLARLIKQRGEQAGAFETPGEWPLFTHLLGRVLAASKQVRHVPPHSKREDERPKCTLMRSLEQMGPGGEPGVHAEFWRQITSDEELCSLRGTYLRRSERLCAVSLVKRFCWPAYFAARFDNNPSELRYSDTATIAAREWIEQAHERLPKFDLDEIRQNYWSGQWLFQSEEQWREAERPQGKGEEDDDRDPPPPEKVRTLLMQAREKMRDCEEPPRYYAAFVFDGDHMGHWLRGEKGPSLGETYHFKLVQYFENLGPKAADALKERRPLSPALHAAITAALGAFARERVPEIVQAHKGELIYAGGDDALALLPTRHALSCLAELRRAYSGCSKSGMAEPLPPGWERAADGSGRILTLMGEKATASAGVAVAHYKADLRDVLQAARQAEQAAKAAGRDALGISILRRSGEHRQVVCPWEFVPVVNAFVTAFRDGASDRWAYHLYSEEDLLGALEGEDIVAVEALLRRAIGRTESKTKNVLANVLPSLPLDGAQASSTEKGEEENQASDRVARCYQHLHRIWRERKECEAAARQPRVMIHDFIALVQAASFLARGRAAGED
jgi:CRISPR-associated protein Cmr2